jgi:hypothetical protein
VITMTPYSVLILRIPLVELPSSDRRPSTSAQEVLRGPKLRGSGTWLDLEESLHHPVEECFSLVIGARSVAHNSGM